MPVTTLRNFIPSTVNTVLGEAETPFGRDSPCADGEVVVIIIYRIMACIIIYTGLVNAV
jgi:hypothetical protein